MKIIHLANHCHEIGNGIMNVAVDLACTQSGHGHEVTFASAGGSYVQLLAQYGVRHIYLKQDWRKPWSLPRTTLKLWKILSKVAPDIVHAHMMTGALLAKAVRFGQRYRLITTVHNEWQRSSIAMGVGDRVICVSSSVAVQMAVRGVSAKKLEVVRNAPLGSPRRALPPPDGPNLGHPAILTVAGLYVRKGIGDLIDAFAVVAASHPSVTLTIVGDGPDRAIFERQGAATGFIDRIRFAGFQADPRAYYRGADIFVLASRSEPFGLVIAEARELGCAIVGTQVGGIPEVLEDGRAGLLVPSNDPRALSGVLRRLINDPDYLAQWRAAAVLGLEWLDVRRAALETDRIYSRAIGREHELAAISLGHVP